MGSRAPSNFVFGGESYFTHQASRWNSSVAGHRSGPALSASRSALSGSRFSVGVAYTVLLSAAWISGWMEPHSVNSFVCSRPRAAALLVLDAPRDAVGEELAVRHSALQLLKVDALDPDIKPEANNSSSLMMTTTAAPNGSNRVDAGPRALQSYMGTWSAHGTVAEMCSPKLRCMPMNSPACAQPERELVSEREATTTSWFKEAAHDGVVVLGTSCRSGTSLQRKDRMDGKNITLQDFQYTRIH